jgi:hypothetical protein
MATIGDESPLAASIVKHIDDTDKLCRDIGNELKRLNTTHSKNASPSLAIEMQVLQQALESSSQHLSTLCQMLMSLSRVKVQSVNMPVSLAIVRGSIN